MEAEMTLRPMTTTERMYSYTQSQQLIMQTGCIGHLCANFGRDNKHFYTSWDDHRADLKSDDFEHAERLLSIGLSDGHAIAGIARMCGYENALYFSRVFKKHFGCSPSQYVDRQRQIHTVDPGRTELDDQ